MSSYRRTLTRAITFFGGLYFVLEFLLPKTVLEAVGVAAYHDNISYGFITVGAVSFGLGLINLLMHHGSKLIFVRKGWVHSTALLSGLFLMMGVSLMEWYESLVISDQVQEITILGEFAERIYADSLREEIPTEEKVGTEVGVKQVLPTMERVGILVTEAEKLQESFNMGRAIVPIQEVEPEKLQKFYTALEAVKSARLAGTFSKDTQAQFSAAIQDFGSSVRSALIAQQAQGVVKNLYDFLFIGLFTALGSAMFSLLAVYIAAAAYRAFAVRSFESFLMMSAAVLVILGQTSFGLYVSEYFPAIRLWLLETPNSAAFRAIKIGAGVAGLVMAFRMWFSIESESFSGERA